MTFWSHKECYYICSGYTSKSRRVEAGRIEVRELQSLAVVKLLKGRCAADTAAAYQEKQKRYGS